MSYTHYTKAQREAIVARYKALLADGLSEAMASKVLSVARGTLKRWANPPAKKKVNKGGRPLKTNLNAEESQVFQAAVLKYGYIAPAVGELLESHVLTKETAQILGSIVNKASNEGKRPLWGAQLHRLANIPEGIQADYRGVKHRRQYEPKARRNGMLVMEDGTEILWQPGFVYESDDMSVNEPFRFYDPGLGHETIGRQGLFSLDACSNFKLQLDLCGRPRDAYRIEDIADHFLSIVDRHGLPLFWRLEMGSWASNFVKGIKLKEREERWGALSDLFYVRHKFNSTGKANIERSFHEQQKLSAHASTSIGRKRGEFEKATKLHAKARRGNPDALRYFWNIADCANALADILGDQNRTKRRYTKLNDLYASPEELFKSYEPRNLEDDDRWYFCPVKRQATIRDGVIEVKVDHYPLSFRFLAFGAPDFPILGHGYPVLIAFHPGRPEEGCHVFNRAVGVENIQGYAFGEKIGMIPLFADVPEEDLSPEANFSQVSKGAAAIRSESRTIVPAGTGPGTLKSVARDGIGNALEVQKGGKPSPPEPKKKGTTPDIAPVKPKIDRPAPEPVKMSRFSRGDAASEIEKLTKSLTD